MSEPIAAIATPPVPSAIGIVRVSGEGAIEAASAVFRAASGRPLAACESRRLVYGTLLGPDGAPIDQVLATLSRAPHSYTGEDTAELQCHGSPAVLAMALESLFAPGRPAGRAGGVHQAGLPQRKNSMIPPPPPWVIRVFPLRKARLVNSPGPACRTPWANRDSSAIASTAGEPWHCSSAVSSPV